MPDRHRFRARNGRGRCPAQSHSEHGGSPDGFHPGPFGVRGRETEHMGQQFEAMPRTPGRRRVNVMRCAGVVMVIAVVLSTAFKAMPA